MAITIIIKNEAFQQASAARAVRSQSIRDDLGEMDARVDGLATDLDAELALIDAALLALANEAWSPLTQAQRVDALRDGLRAALRFAKFALQTFRLLRRVARVTQRVGRFVTGRAA